MITDIDINSNIKLHYIPLKKLKTTTMGINIHRQLDKEEASYNALLPYVLKSGCKRCVDTEHISKYLENLYGATLGATVMKCGDDQIMYFESEAISDRYAPENETIMSSLFDLLFSIIFEPITENGVFKSDTVEIEKNNAVNRIEAMKNDKRIYASTRCQQEMCKNELFAVPYLGDADKISAITSETLYSYYKKMITSSIMDIYICGDADMDVLSKKIVDMVKDIEFEKAILPTTEILLSDKSDVNTVTDKMDVVQGKMSIGFRTNISVHDDDFFALRVMNSVFGAGAHSKLFNNVREKLSLAYYASSSIERYKGLLIVNSGVEFVNFEKAYKETLVQLENIKNGDISDLEFESSINSLVNSMESLRDDQRAMQSFYMGEKISGTNMEISEIVEGIKKVTKNDVVMASKKMQLDTVYYLTGKEEK